MTINMGRSSTLLTVVWITFLYFHIASSCSLQGVTGWFLDLNVMDTDRGVIFEATTTSITGIESASHTGDSLNMGPYFVATHETSNFTLGLHENFADYEEYETVQSMSVQVVFSCSDGGTITQLFVLFITDTNNNDPVFTPTDDITFKVTPPLPPGYQLTSAINSIIVRDIDLTTQRIDFEIEENDFFEISYDTTNSYAVKSFGAILRTATFIRSLPEPVTVRISATDVDTTGDPPRTTYANLIIEADGDFVFPEEPIFSQVFYLATYTEENYVSLQSPINLQQGFDELVTFNITGEFAEYFYLVGIENLSVGVTSTLPSDVIALGTILLELRAAREYTSGASATLVIRFPEASSLAFAQLQYEGIIIDNDLSMPVLTLAQGYENDFEITFQSEFSSYFTSSIDNNIITVRMSQLPADVIEQNTFITVQVIATSSSSSASAVIVLEIIKNDTSTPVFQESIYVGSYDPLSGLSLVPIILSQGYDDTVQFSKEGEYQSYFELIENGEVVTLQLASGLSDQIIQDEQHLLLTIRAIKPRTVGATAAIAIALPAARKLSFERSNYVGEIENNVLRLENIVLSNGYATDVNFTLLGDHSDFFITTANQNQVTINLVSPLTEDVILNNNFISLTLEASGTNALTAITNIVLQIIKEDLSTPVFGSTIYYGNLQGINGVSVEDISLSQGYDETVTFRLDGEHSQYFTINTNGNNVVAINLQSNIPEDVIYNEKVLVFTIFAEKPSTISANAAVSIHFPSELTEAISMEFTESIYVGKLENNILTLESITLQTGFSYNTQFLLSGEYYDYFIVTINENVVTLSLNSTLPSEATQNNKFILLQLSAERDRAISASAAIVLEIIIEEIMRPSFTASYYQGIYIDGNLDFDQTIRLEQGFDDNISFGLEGEFSEWFSVVENSDEVNVIVNGLIPEEVIANYNHLLFTIVANKTGTVGARAAISIDLPNEVSAVVLRFAQNSYVGSIDNGTLQVEPIALLGEYDNVNLTVYGEYNSYFTLDLEDNLITISLSNDFPIDTIKESKFILLDIEATRRDAISGFTTAVFEIIQNVSTVDMPTFDRPFYTGSYSDEGLVMDYTLQLAQGYDDTIQFELGNEADAQWFSVTSNGNSLTVVIIDEPLNVSNRTYLLFSVFANKRGTLPGSAAILISLSDTLENELRFSQTHYSGSIDNKALTLENINMAVGYSEQIIFSLIGEHNEYFNVTHVDNAISVQLTSELSSEIIDSVNILILTLEGRSLSSVAYATIVIELVKVTDTEVKALFYEEAYYSGSYSEISGLAFDHEIRLIDHFDENVIFTLAGEQNQLFTIQRNNDYVTITVNQIPSDVLANFQFLLLSIIATKDGYFEGKAAIVISLDDDYSSPAILRFEQNRYLGQVETDAIFVGAIVISEGYNDDTSYSLTIRGELEEYFDYERIGNTISLRVVTQIPENILENYRILLLELEVSANQAISAFTTLILETTSLEENLTPLVFAEAYYTGIYRDETLIFDHVISLEQGYNQNVLFTLQEGFEEWFQLDQNENAVAIIITNTISEEILLNNRHLIFTVSASGLGYLTAKTTIVISLEDDTPTTSALSFHQINYRGSIENDVVDLETIVISEGYRENITFTLIGDFNEYFSVTIDNSIVSIELLTEIPEDLISTNRLIILTLQASSNQSIPAFATIILEITDVINEIDFVPIIFSQPFYSGRYIEENNLIFNSIISLSDGYDTSVTFELEGEYSEFFTLNQSGNAAELTLLNPLLSSVLANNDMISFVVRARRSDNNVARATIIITLTFDASTAVVLRFNYISYQGQYVDQEVNLIPIVLSEGYSNEVSFVLHGELSEYFDTENDESIVRIIVANPIPEDLLTDTKFIVLDIIASAQQSISAHATIVLDLTADVEESVTALVFSEVYYIGIYSADVGLTFENDITLQQGYDDTVQFSLRGEDADWFSLQDTGINSVILVPSTIIPVDELSHMSLSVVATKPGVSIAETAIFIIIENNRTTNGDEASFERALYTGTLSQGVLEHEDIRVSGYEGTTVELSGGHSNLFVAQAALGVVSVQAIATVPEDTKHIALELQAGTARTVLLLEVDTETQTNTSDVTFDKALYLGTIVDEVVEHEPITVTGYEGSNVNIIGAYSEQFVALATSGVVSVQADASLTLPEGTTHLALELQAGTARTALVLNINLFESSTEAPPSADDVSFDKALYEGVIDQGNVQHETITVTGYEGTNVNIIGLYSEQFVAEVLSGVVSVQASGSLTLPTDTSHVALELRAESASTALVLTLTRTDEHVPDPTVTFSASSYEIRTDITQTGLIGRVHATADSGEQLTYSIMTDNDHLLERVTVNEEGDLRLSAPAYSGVYTFSVRATTIFTQVFDSAVVRLTVDAITVCGVDDRVLPPLMVLNGDEEIPHDNIVVLDGVLHEGCHLTLNNRWPLDQDWLFVNETGLHARTIDREAASIAFMALSQVQVELILHCDSDAQRASRTKRSSNAHLETLGPYDYGSNKWVLTDAITYNSRRGFVNFIVNDINDNDPIFIGKENEPIAVGYPVPELLDVVTPRALVELTATDADIDENAALLYWSDEPELAVSPSAGTVHIRDNERALEEGSTYFVHATDRNGEGNTGTIQLVLRILDVEKIAVITVRDSFLEDESAILRNISAAVGYDVKSLTSVVISDEYELEVIEEAVKREKRQAIETRGASLQLYVYGLIERNPVDVTQLMSDINNNLVALTIVADTISLEDYMESREISTSAERAVGLLVSTIVLSILLFLLILLISLWFVLKWRKNRRNDNYSDKISIVSKADSIDTGLKPDTLNRPRVNINELKRSERRLQEMLNAPLDNATVEPSTSKTYVNPDTKIEVPVAATIVPIVIQSTDKLKDTAELEDDDEFGEIKTKSGRKSVVTFNEVVEKIIHVDDNLDPSDNVSDYIIEKF